MKQKYFKLLLFAASFIGTAFTGAVFAQIIKSSPLVTSSVGELYTYDVSVYPLGDSAFFLDESLAGMTIDQNTGVISWTPSGLDQGGQVTVRVTVDIYSDIQTFNVYVSDGVECDASMISYWKLDETEGTSFADFKGGYTAVTGIAPEAVDGVIYNGQQFNPASDIRLSIANNENQYDWNTGDDISGALWFKSGVDINTRSQVFMGRLGASGGPNDRHWWWFGLDTNNYVTVNLTNDVGALSEGEPGYPNMLINHSNYGVYYSDNIWHFAVFTLDGNASNQYTLKIYVDGVLNQAFNATRTFPQGNFTSTADLNIGWWQNPWQADYYEFDGSLDEIALYKRALTPSEIMEMYNDGKAAKAYCQPGNYAPLFISDPVLTATEDELYSYSIITSDYDVNNTLTITKVIGPDWLSLDNISNGTATLSGTPQNADVGTNEVTIAVNDGKVTINQSFSIEVTNVNDMPTIISTPITNAAINTFYQYWVETHDDEDEELTCEAILKPSWATFTYNPGTGIGILSGTPTASDSIRAYVSIKVTDSDDGSFTQQFTITVQGGLTAIDDLNKNNGIKVYPSPATEYVWIEYEDNFKNGSFQLISLTGALIKEYTIRGETTMKIDLSDVKQGIYIYKLTGNEVIVIGKIAKE